MIIIKKKKEIQGISECCKIVAEVLDAVADAVKPGISTIDIELIADKIIKQNKAKSAFKGYSVPGLHPYPSILCTSLNSCIVHGIPKKETILKEGDILGVDVGVMKDGYYGDGARTYAIGVVSEAAKRLMDITATALSLGLSQAKAGLTVGDISAAIGDYVTQKGYFVADSLTGHGVGKELHEEPMIPNIGLKGTGPKLRSGMTLAIEPMVNIGTNKVVEKGWEFFVADNSLSAHYEHTILVTDNEPVILTK